MKRRLTCEPLVRRELFLYVVPSLLSVLIAFGSGASGVDSGRDCRIVEWSGAAESVAPNWSDPDNWVGGARPGACDVAKLGPAALDSVVDSEFDGEIAGLILDRAYAGTLRLRRGLTIAGDLSVAGDGSSWEYPVSFRNGSSWPEARLMAGGQRCRSTAPSW